MAKRLKNLKPKKNKKMGCTHKCYSCVHYDFEVDCPFGNEIYNECVKKGLETFSLEPQKFCKDYKAFNNLSEFGAYIEDIELPWMNFLKNAKKCLS